MATFTIYTRKIFLSTFMALIISCVLWFFLPHKLFFQGLILGIACSLLNGWVTLLKTKQITDYAANGSGKVRGVGMLSRMLVAIFAIFLTIEYPNYFSLAGVLTGLFSVQAFSFIHAIGNHFSNNA